MVGEARRGAHSWLADIAARVGNLRVPVDISDSDLCDMAADRAREALNLAAETWLRTSGAIRERLARFAAGYGLRCPALPYLARSGKMVGIEDGPAIARMTDEHWWRRGLRKAQARALEGAAIRLGYVRKGAEVYASNATVERRAQQRRRNVAALESTRAVNLDTGGGYALGELVEHSVANPRIRRGELMTRLAGFDRIAADMGHVAEFVTLTCPVEFHPYKADGRENRGYAGATPREAQQWLVRTWAKCRAKLARMGCRLYGFRVAEPHKTGTPHWHAVLFMSPWLSAGRAMVPRVRAVIRRYFLGPEPDAARKAHGVAFLAIDREAYEGGAAGYLAKYIAKNIDGGGYQVQMTLDGGETIDASVRVEAWASTWGIRQFQQVGGPPVGVWREARRLDAFGEYSDAVESVRVAADVGRKTQGQRGRAAQAWSEFVGLMGGPTVSRRDMPVRVAYTRAGERWDYVAALPYPANPTRYGEIAPGAVYGLRDVLRDRGYASVRYRWEIKRIKREGGARWASADSRPAGEIQQCAAFPLGFEVGRECAPRTRVNNCTRRDEDESCGAGLAPEIRHPGGIGFASGQDDPGACGPDHRRTGGNHRGHGGGAANHSGLVWYEPWNPGRSGET
jgi:hypothetical protein